MYLVFKLMLLNIDFSVIHHSNCDSILVYPLNFCHRYSRSPIGLLFLKDLRRMPNRCTYLIECFNAIYEKSLDYRHNRCWLMYLRSGCDLLSKAVGGGGGNWILANAISASLQGFGGWAPSWVQGQARGQGSLPLKLTESVNYKTVLWTENRGIQCIDLIIIAVLKWLWQLDRYTIAHAMGIWCCRHSTIKNFK
jgi:hypothetical protein